MTFEDWEKTVPDQIKIDTVWKVKAYRLALFLSDLAWHDGEQLIADRRSESIGDQLIRAASKISSCISEGYSRNTGKGRAVFYEYAAGSTREARDWYYKGRHVLKPAVVEHRIGVCTELLKLAIKMTSNERRSNRHIDGQDPEGPEDAPPF